MVSFLGDLKRDGFVILERQVDSVTLQKLRADLNNSFSGRQAGIRDLLKRVPEVLELARSEGIRTLVERVLGESARVVRCIYFDKQKNSNWKVAWHQDLTIAVKRQADVTGFTAWSIKAGVQHVQPPTSILEQMIAVRIHLDDADETNGCLRVIPGSHLLGRLTADQITHVRTNNEIVSCAVRSGDVMLMRPLLLHASSVALQPAHRRVVHLEYCAATLPKGLEWYEQL
jgi:ectoine hydroxylase-related dioxygenase (phytanoyl-CoA dioxygenase family)